MSLLDDILASQGTISDDAPAAGSYDEQLAAANEEIFALSSSKYEDKVANVEAKAAEKRAKIAPKPRHGSLNPDGSERPFSQFQNLDNGYTNYRGKPIQNHNKIYNSYNTKQMQDIMSNVYNQRVYTDDETGEKYQMLGSDGARTPYDGGRTGFIYGGNSKTDEGIDKFGYSAFGVKERYSPGLAKNEDGTPVTMPNGELYGWESGKEGIDQNNAYMNWELPDELARQFEGVIHGNTGSLDARDMFDDGSKESALRRQQLGSGASEYYDDKKMALFGRKDKDGNFVDTPAGGVWNAASNKDDGWLGENIDVMQAAATGLAAETVQMVDEVGNALSPDVADQTPLTRKINELFGISDPEGFMKNFDAASESINEAIGFGEGNFLGSGRNVRDFLEYDEKGNKNKGHMNAKDLFAGVSPEFRNSFATDMKKANKALDDGNYVEWAKNAVPNIGSLLAESIPEMAAIMAPGMIFAVIAKRVNSYSNEYKHNNNGEDPSAKQMAGMAVWETVNLFAEKIGMKLGGKYLKDAIMKKTRDKLWKRVGQTIGAIAVGTGFEGVQEGSEFTSEKYMSQDQSPDKKKSVLEIATSNEADQAVATGSLLGFSMSTGGTAAAGLAAVPGRIKSNLDDAQVRNDIANMSEPEFEMQIEDIDDTISATNDVIVNLDASTAELETIETAEDLANTEDDNVIAIREHETRTILNSDESLEREEVKENALAIIENVIMDPTSKAEVIVRLELDEEATDKEIIESFEENYLDNVRNILMDSETGVTSAVAVSEDVILEENKDKIVESTKERTKKMIEFAKKRKQDEIKVMTDNKTRAQEIRNENKPGKSFERSDKEIKREDVGSSEIEAKTGIGTALKALYSVIPGSPSKRKALKREVQNKLTGYSDAALKSFIEEETSKEDGDTVYSDMANEVLDSRVDTRNRDNTGRGKTSTVDYDVNNEYDKEEDSKFSLDPSKKQENRQKIRRLVTQENIDSQEEFDKIHRYINELENHGTLNQKQADLLRRRLATNSANIEPGAKDEYARNNAFETAAEIREGLKKDRKELAKVVKAMMNIKLDAGSTAEDVRESEQAVGEIKTFIDQREAELAEVEKLNPSQNQQSTEDTAEEEDVEEEVETEDEEETDAEEDVEENTEEETEEESTENESTESGDNAEYKGYSISLYGKALGPGGYIGKGGIVVASTSDLEFNSMDMLKKIVDGMADGKTEAEAKKAALGKSEDTEATTEATTETETISEEEVVKKVDEVAGKEDATSTHDLKANGIIENDTQVEEVLSPDEFFKKYGNPLC